MDLPVAAVILLAIAAVLALLSAFGYLREGKLLPQHRIWLTIAAIFVVVSFAVELVG